jgi:hypothetical protein
VEDIKDIGATIDEELSFANRIYDKINKAYQMKSPWEERAESIFSKNDIMAPSNRKLSETILN